MSHLFLSFLFRDHNKGGAKITLIVLSSLQFETPSQKPKDSEKGGKSYALSSVTTTKLTYRNILLWEQIVKVMLKAIGLVRFV
jgi:hypothetical protein